MEVLANPVALRFSAKRHGGAIASQAAREVALAGQR